MKELYKIYILWVIPIVYLAVLNIILEIINCNIVIDIIIAIIAAILTYIGYIIVYRKLHQEEKKK